MLPPSSSTRRTASASSATGEIGQRGRVARVAATGVDAHRRARARLPALSLFTRARLELRAEQARPEATCPVRVIGGELDQRELGAGHLGRLVLLGQQRVAVDHGACDVDQLAVAGASVVSQQGKGSRLVDRVALHENALRPLGHGSPAERSLEVVELGEAAQDDVDRALPIDGIAVGDVGEDAALRCLLHEPWIRLVDEQDHRAGGLLNDLLDQGQGVDRALSQAHERDIRPLPHGHGSDVVDLDLASDHLVPQRGDDRRDEGQPIAPFVRDQYSEMFGFSVTHPDSETGQSSRGKPILMIRFSEALPKHSAGDSPALGTRSGKGVDSPIGAARER